MNNLIRNNFVELFAIIVVFVDLFYTIIPPVPLILALILVSLYRTGLIGGYFLSSFALPILLGSTLYTLGITRIATIVELLLFGVCVYQWKVKRSIFFLNYHRGIAYMFSVLLVFVFSSLISTGGDFAITKLINAITCGLFVFFAYGFLLSNPGKCDYTRVGLNLILYSFLMLLLSPLLNQGGGPSNFLDFGYLRLQNTYALAYEQVFLIDYQHVGFFATMGCGCIFLGSKKNQLNSTFLFLCIALCTVVSLYSGARQFVVISLVLLMLWAFFQRKKSSPTLFYVLAAISVIVFILSSILEQGGMLYSVKDEGYLEASGRAAIMMKGIDDFLKHPILGVGFGRFEFSGRYDLYPHNLVVESLCELGCLGLLIIVFIVYKPFRYLIKNQKQCLFLLSVYFLRSMASGGLDSNIMLFSFIFAVLSLKNTPVLSSSKK
jgi:O-antigen ligase